MPKRFLYHLNIIVSFIFFLHSNLVLAQSDSTNLPGLSASIQAPTNSSLGSGVPDPNQLDAVTTTTETEVLPCPSGYYPNAPIPTDGSNVTYTDQAVQGGVVYDQTVTTNRYGTTTYGGWYEVNFLCTQIPPAPTCPTGETEVSAPYWDSTTNQWVGIVCQQPIPAGTIERNACNQVLGSLDPYEGSLVNPSPGQTLFGTLSGPYNGPGLTQYNNYIDNPYCGFALSKSVGSMGTPSANNDLFIGTDGFGGIGYCWIAPGSSAVSGALYELEAPNSCGGGPN